MRCNKLLSKILFLSKQPKKIYTIIYTMEDYPYLNIVLGIGIVILIYTLVGKNKKNTSGTIKTQNIINTSVKNNSNEKPFKLDPNFKKLFKTNHIKNIPINPHFREQQFHTDFQDIISIISDITKEKLTFNQHNLEVDSIIVEKKEANKLGKYIVDKINSISQKHSRIPISSPSGFDVEYSSLSVPFGQTNKKSLIELAEVTSAKLLKTKKDEMYEITIVISKENIVDQMVVQVNVKNGKTYRFGNHYILGFLTKTQNILTSGSPSYFAFDDYDKAPEMDQFDRDNILEAIQSDKEKMARESAATIDPDERILPTKDEMENGYTISDARELFRDL